MTRRGSERRYLASAAVAAGPAFARRRSQDDRAAAAAKQGRQAADRRAQASPIDPRIFRPAAAATGSVGSVMGRIRRQPSRAAIAQPRTGGTSWSSTSMRRWLTAFGSMSRSSTRCCRILRADIRAQTGQQDFVGTAPLNLVYVAHGERMQDISPRRPSPLCVGRYRLHRSERLSVLRIGGTRDGLPWRRRLRQARQDHATREGPVRDLRADRWLSARLKQDRDFELNQ